MNAFGKSTEAIFLLIVALEHPQERVEITNNVSLFFMLSFDFIGFQRGRQAHKGGKIFPSS